MELPLIPDIDGRRPSPVTLTQGSVSSVQGVKGKPMELRSKGETRMVDASGMEMPANCFRGVRLP